MRSKLFCSVIIMQFSLVACNAENEFADSSVSRESVSISVKNPANAEVAKSEKPQNEPQNEAPQNEAPQKDYEDKDRPKGEEELAACDIKGKKDISLAGSKKTLDVTSQDIVMAKVTGNQSELTIDFNTGSGRLKGLCLMFAGNNQTIRIKSSISFDKVQIKGRGNQSRTYFELSNDAAFNQLDLDLQGNDPQVLVNGEKI